MVGTGSMLQRPTVLETQRVDWTGREELRILKIIDGHEPLSVAAIDHFNTVETLEPPREFLPPLLYSPGPPGGVTNAGHAHRPRRGGTGDFLSDWFGHLKTGRLYLYGLCCQHPDKITFIIIH